MLNISNLNYKFEGYLIILIPIFLVFSRFLLEFSLLLLTFSFLFRLFKKKEFLFIKNNFSIFFSIYFIFLVLSFLLSQFKHETYTILFYFRFYLYILALSYFFVKEKNFISYFFNSIIFVIIILVVDSSVQFFYGKNILGYENGELHRITSFFDDEQILGSFTTKMFVFLLFAKIIIDQTKKKTHIFLNISLIGCPILIFLSGERASLLMFFIMIFYYLIFLHREKRIRFFYFFSFFSIVLVMVFLFSSKTYYDRYVTQTISSIFDKNYSQNQDLMPNNMKGNYNFYFLSAQHQNFMITSLNIYKQNKILGSGPKSFRHICADESVNISFYSCNTHPHNYYLQLISETGLVGFLIILSVYLYIILKSIINFYHLVKNKKYEILEIVILGYYFAQLWPITQTGNFFNNYNSIMFFLPLSIYMSILFKKKNNN